MKKEDDSTEATSHLIHINGISTALLMVKKKQDAAEQQERGHDQLKAEDKLTNVDSHVLEDVKTQEQADCDAIFGTKKYGFYIYKTSELHGILEEYVSDPANLDPSGKPPQKQRKFLSSLNKLFLRFVKHKVFDANNMGEGELEIMHRAVTGAKVVTQPRDCTCAGYGSSKHQLPMRRRFVTTIGLGVRARLAGEIGPMDTTPATSASPTRKDFHPLIPSDISNTYLWPRFGSTTQIGMRPPTGMA